MSKNFQPEGMSERETTVYQLFFVDKSTISQVGDELGVSRSVVSGLASRMRAKWPRLDEVRPRDDPIIRDGNHRQAAAAKMSAAKPRRKSKPAQRPAAPRRPAPRTDAERLEQRADDFATGRLRGVSANSCFTTCQWPIGEPGDDDFHHCGAATAPAHPYCPTHCARAYQPRGSVDLEVA